MADKVNLYFVNNKQWSFLVPVIRQVGLFNYIEVRSIVSDRRVITKFNGKVSWWFYAIIIGVAALLIPIIIVSAFVDTNVVALIINLLVLVAVELFCIPIIFHNFVELQNETLLIVFGFIKKRIPYSDIVALSTTNNPLSSLAASLDRIEIKCKSKSNAMISVIDKERFFNEMKKYNPNITII